MVKINVEEFVDKREPVKGKRMSTGYYTLKLKNEDISNLKKQMEKKRDKNQIWAEPLYGFILQNIKYDPRSDFDINKILKEFEETIIAMADKMKSIMEFDETIKQKEIKDFDENAEMKEDLKKKRKGD